MQLKPTIKVLSLSARNKAAQRYQQCETTTQSRRDRMTTFRITILFLILTNPSFSQLVITGGLPDNLQNPKTTFHIDTTSINKDSVFVIVKQFDRKVLIFEEAQIFIGDKIIFHGQSRQWYKNGKKKSEGKFYYGKKWGLWKYWDKKGYLTQDTDQLDEEIKLRGVVDYFYINGEKVRIRKANE